MSTSAHHQSLFELDRELDLLLDTIQEQSETNGSGQIDPALIEQFHQFCNAYNKKVDRIGHFLEVLEARAGHCRAQAARLAERARSAENKLERTQKMVLYYLESRGIIKIEGLEFTLRRQKNSQDSVVVQDEPLVPLVHRDVEAKIPGGLWLSIQRHLSEEEKKKLQTCIRQMPLSSGTIKAAAAANEEVPGVKVQRGFHLRVA